MCYAEKYALLTSYSSLVLHNFEKWSAEATSLDHPELEYLSIEKIAKSKPAIFFPSLWQTDFILNGIVIQFKENLIKTLLNTVGLTILATPM